MSSLEQTLKRKVDQRYHKYEDFVEKVRHILAYQQEPFDTHAGEKHVRGVIQNLDRLLPSEVKEALSPEELYLLLIATWLHDIGKIRNFDSSKSYEEQSDYHASKGFDYITQNYGLFNLDEKEALIIAYIVKSHGLFDLSKLPEKKGLGAGVIKIRRLAAVLCLADELDIEYGRVPEIVKEISGIEDLPKWDIRSSIDGVEIQSKTWDIVVHCTPKNYETLDGIKKTIEWINKRLNDLRVFLEELDLHYKVVELRIDDIHLRSIQSKEGKKTTQAPSKVTQKIITVLCPFSKGSCNREIETDDKKVFVGIPFSAIFTDLYAFAIVPALQKFSLKPWRADEVASFGPIFCKICEAIRECKFAILDISEANPNVMFELGMAAAMGKRVVLIKNYKNRVPSDLAGFEYVSYHNLHDLHEGLFTWIRRLLDLGDSD